MIGREIVDQRVIQVYVFELRAISFFLFFFFSFSFQGGLIQATVPVPVGYFLLFSRFPTRDIRRCAEPPGRIKRAGAYQAQDINKSPPPLTLSPKPTMRFFSTALVILSTLMASSLALPVSLSSPLFVFTPRAHPLFPQQVQQQDLIKKAELPREPGQDW